MDPHSPLRRAPTNTSDTDLDEAASLSAVQSTASSVTSIRPSLPTGRTPSTHSLLAAHKSTDGRKSAHAETTRASADRSGTSMPPPATKPITDRRFSSSISSIRSFRRSEDGPRSPPGSIKSFEVERLPFGASPGPQTSTTALDPTVVTTASTSRTSGLPLLSTPASSPIIPNQTILVSGFASHGNAQAVVPQSEPSLPAGQTLGTPVEPDGTETALPTRAPRVTQPRSTSSNRRLSTAGSARNESVGADHKAPFGRIGVCALDVKARSRPSRQILTRLQGDGEFDVIVFGDKAILDEDVENWPICDYLISFFSDGFPLDKAIAYAKLRKPFVVNDLPMQKVLWDRRLCLKILDQMHIPTPRRIEVNRDGGPKLESAELAQHVRALTGVVLEGPEDGTGGGAPLTQKVELVDEGDTIVVDGKHFKKPFVEKPVNGEDHNVIIYFPKSQEGGARRLFRKIGNKSSEYDPNLIVPRSLTEENSSYIYEQFLRTENSEDVKAYTVGPNYCHAETRKSPVVDGLVRRNTHGKELRYVTKLSEAEREMASKVSQAFGQRICGFDMLRTGTASYVIDVNGWSFVKDNEDYYNDCARILRGIFLAEKFKKENGILDEQTSEIGADGSHHRRHGTNHSHRSALKTILRSPSMTKLSQHLPYSSRHHAGSISTSTKTSSATTPLSSPPTIEKDSNAAVPPATIDNADLLPPPKLASSAPAGLSTEPIVPIKQPEEVAPLPASKHSWKLKGVVTVIRHADRTPKQKIKFTAHSQVFADLLKGHHEEVLLKGEAALASVEAAVKIAQKEGLEDPDKLRNLQIALAKKGKQPGTKVQIKPMFRKRKPEEMTQASNDALRATSPDGLAAEAEPFHLSESPSTERAGSISDSKDLGRMQARSDSISGTTFSRFSAAENDLVLDKLQLVMKWGGEPTHSARYQSQDLGTNMRDDFKLLNRELLEDVRIFTSSENRVRTSAQIWAAAFLDRQDLPEDFITVRKDLLDDSNAAKDVMDKVKKKLKHLLREGSVPEEFAWPKDVPEPYAVMQTVIELLRFHRRVMRHNFKKLATGATASLAALKDSAEGKDSSSQPKEYVSVASIQSRWCTGEDPDLFKERWEKLFSEFCDTEKADPSKISELYDTMKYDALHNKQFLEWVFTPSQSLLEEMAKDDSIPSSNPQPPPEPERSDEPSASTGIGRHESMVSSSGSIHERHSFAQKIGLRRQSILKQPLPTPPLMSWEQGASYFKLFTGSGDSRSMVDQRLSRLRELYRYSKILFDYIGPQEYGISNDEKLEIGLLTSLPLLREIVSDLEELQASGDAKFFVYFTKESHIYTLLNCIMEGGIHTKIKRSTIPELDYLSQICFELYEAKDAETDESTYSIRISISPGCHTIDPLDVSLDSKHAIGSAQRRSLTDHQDWKEVISTLKAKFNTVQLPKSFLAVNVSYKHEQEAQRRASLMQGEAAKAAAAAAALGEGEEDMQVDETMADVGHDQSKDEADEVAGNTVPIELPSSETTTDVEMSPNPPS
ncbi:hypothetical protein A1O1_04352 [Capronia coronata CBS 617.96]|uniref:Inositol hexakisphosphate and diphosphoinositol-pentakisphosphate kinase n=1 Tax=Capronia coronata CBS 617.96 TaxID=1182541 RepID=W9YED6_9EURO|nr:uncharacterized protein A1O1_04352 [Capronia coronata CBS 617.96]EXJ91242.1 hypothetical protein A1O1_04352 [Capronia coronata CBS 617.96]